LALAAVVMSFGSALSPAPASAAPAGLTTALTSWSFDAVPAATYVNGPTLFVSSSVDGVTLTSSSPDAPFVKSSDTCDGSTTAIQNDICHFQIDFDNLSSPLSRGHYRTTFTISDAATGHALLRVRYTATVT
jgi:hypothetical protein